MDKLPPRNRKRATAEALNKIAQLKRDIARDQTRITFLRRYVAAMEAEEAEEEKAEAAPLHPSPSATNPQPKQTDESTTHPVAGPDQ